MNHIISGSIFFILLIATGLTGCSRGFDQPSIIIYYNHEGIDSMSNQIPDFEKIAEVRPSAIRDLGVKEIDSSTYQYILHNFNSERYAPDLVDSVPTTTYYNTYILFNQNHSDQLILNNTNSFHSPKKGGRLVSDTLAYLIRDHIQYYNAFALPVLRSFPDFMKFQANIDYDYLSQVDTTQMPSRYSKIVLVPAKAP
jgi:uncharacterized protein YlbG (UPF0298 family)